MSGDHQIVCSPWQVRVSEPEPPTVLSNKHEILKCPVPDEVHLPPCYVVCCQSINNNSVELTLFQASSDG